MTAGEQQLLRLLHDAYVRAKNEVGYHATIFIQMLDSRGALSTARFLINSAKPSEGYTALWERGRLDLTVEAVVLENAEIHYLFESSDLDKARKRLVQYGYNVPR
ncbi:MAG: hypothetical protein DI568_04345 [Sphingomonas sp.]|nr:MAG: hypothetical protein DI568_04345 [Sphingomonas sp.]